jgi:mannose-1-phosphate guanylyltransferase/mannose-6-phosphate isomerase
LPSLQPVLLAGGSGSRLWPMSRETYPKQLLSLTGEHTLLQDTVTRLDGFPQAQETSGVTDVRAPLIVCNEEHRFLVADQLRQIGVVPWRILLEPFGRNTAPALTLAALAVKEGEDAVMLVMPADHIINDITAFQAAVVEGAALAVDDRLVTFGITPDRPETGYGYIKTGPALAARTGQLAPRKIAAFVEKPDLETAQRYVDSGEYLWNSGLFMMKASVWLDAIADFEPEIERACREAYEYGHPEEAYYFVGRADLEACPSNSIDYAVMERVTGEAAEESPAYRTAVVPLTAGWSDVGAWSALWDIRAADENENVVAGDVYAIDTHDSLLIAEHRLVAAVGLDNLVVVETSDAVLVARKDRAQDIKQIVERLKAEQRDEHRTHRKVHRPWGSFEGLDAGERFQVKRLTVKPGAAISLQLHHHRAEHWVVVKGTARVTRGEEHFLVSENQSTFIPVGTRHRLENPGKVPLEIIEVQSGSYLAEDDIVRFEDLYKREVEKG